MATIGFAELPVPEGGDSPDVPAKLADLATVLDPHLVQHCEDQADRDSRFATAPAQMLVIAEDGTAWMKLVAISNTWVTVHQPLQDWQSGITLQTGFQVGDVALGLRATETGKYIHLKGRIERTDGLNINDTNAVNLGAVPTELIPVDLRTYPAACSLGGTTTDATGRLEILGEDTTSAYGVAGDILWWYQGTDGTAWVDISGSYWLD